ncbi:hypothetical protein WA1_02760 [Scytonema hofmannii PCC 7110]|uniref:Lipoprotein n=1 Tax=Scytonema hofmannii PCC 7110 TaxID=128403 RepID=A0A139XHB1_9CYAN|nr:hypothetical protein [Scytonema hofmannii]KYC44080.1 hypothetical protein WA1_02760 [Scytonema hofmannii PCC 7110]
MVSVKKSLCLNYAIALLYLLTSCSVPYQTVRIKDVRKLENINISKASSQGNIHSISIRGTGKLDGTANIGLIVDGKLYKSEKAHNSINFKWDNDWYSNTAVIRYSPIDVKSGELTIDYRFHN